MGAEYLSYVKSIATFALTFFGYIISVLASVHHAYCLQKIQSFSKDSISLFLSQIPNLLQYCFLWTILEFRSRHQELKGGKPSTSWCITNTG